MGDHDNSPYFDAFKATGMKVIVIDPVRSEPVEVFGADHIAIRPHTVVAMMLGVAHALCSEGLHDQDFLDEYTAGFDDVLPCLLGETDGTP